MRWVAKQQPVVPVSVVLANPPVCSSGCKEAERCADAVKEYGIKNLEVMVKASGSVPRIYYSCSGRWFPHH